MVMMTAAEVLQGGVLVLAGTGLLVLAAVACLALMRGLIFIVTAIVLVGFAFDAELQSKFTAALLGWLALLYLPPLVVAVVWRQATRRRVVIAGRIAAPSAAELAQQAIADDEARVGTRQHLKAARERDRREQEGDDRRTRDLEQQGAFSLWNQ